MTEFGIVGWVSESQTCCQALMPAFNLKSHVIEGENKLL